MPPLGTPLTRSTHNLPSLPRPILDEEIERTQQRSAELTLRSLARRDFLTASRRGLILDRSLGCDVSDDDEELMDAAFEASLADE